MNFTLKDYSTLARKLTPKWNYTGMLVSHWASRRDTCLKDTYLYGIPR